VDGCILSELEERVVPECVLAGCGVVAGPPEWTSSTREEAAGALAALMGALVAGWKGDIDLRLDNDSAVSRAGGLVMGDRAPCPWEDGMLEKGHLVENADIWTEFVAWRDRHCSRGAAVKVEWHPGHPERRARREDWGPEDRAIYVADQLAEAVHDAPAAPRAPTDWSHKPDWTVHWRGAALTGNVAKRLEDIVRTEHLAAYVQSVGVGPGTDTQWLIPELLARTIGRRPAGLGDRVHRAKVVADILGTMHTQHRRGGLEDCDALCRLCGDALETDSHVLWECKHTATGAVRRRLSKKVHTAWRAAGLGSRELAVVNALWCLKEDDTVKCRSAASIADLLGPYAEQEARLLEEALLGHTLDTSGLYSDRAGLFGRGWLKLLRMLGLTKPAALDALVAVAGVLQGSDGTQAIWRAFTTVLDTPERGVAGGVASQLLDAAAFGTWAADLRGRLRDEGVEDDGPYRALSSASATGMSTQDMSNFLCLVQDWIDAIELGDAEISADVRTWADTLPEAIELAEAAVAQDRRARGRRKITARERARADAKNKALERRTDLLRGPLLGNTRRDKELLRKSIAKLAQNRTLTVHSARRRQGGTETRRTRHGRSATDRGQRPRESRLQPLTHEAALPPVVTLAQQQEARRHRAERRSLQCTGVGQAVQKRAKLCMNNDGARKRGAAGQSEQGQNEPLNKRLRDDAGPTTVRTKNKRGAGPSEDQESGAPAKRSRSTKQQCPRRGRELCLDNSDNRDKRRRANTREQRSIGTTNLEPD
jgi:hypothetical protein